MSGARGLDKVKLGAVILIHRQQRGCAIRPAATAQHVSLVQPSEQRVITVPMSSRVLPQGLLQKRTAYAATGTWLNVLQQEVCSLPEILLA